MYFLVKRCSVLYLYANDGTFSQSPYLDIHGEVDISMRYAPLSPSLWFPMFKQSFKRRGRRQYLHHARWEEIRKTWLNHGIPTVVARKLESTVDSGGWETLWVWLMVKNVSCSQFAIVSACSPRSLSYANCTIHHSHPSNMYRRTPPI